MTTTITRFCKIFVALLLLLGMLLAICAPRGMRVMGQYATSLEGRTRGQRANALRAAHALDGFVIAPGALFSFNKAVGSWSPDRGYVRAPVSYDGELVVDWGGGVCQTSTTLYNAALLAGLSVVQRHRHNWGPGYVPPGRDAAVAQTTIDLQLRNPYPWPVELHTRTSETQLGFTVLGRQPGPITDVAGVTQSTTAPLEIRKTDAQLPHGARRVINHGRSGVRVSIYRTFLRGPSTGRRELVSQDSYSAMDRVIVVGR